MGELHRHYIVGSSEYAAHMNTTHWHTLKNLSIVDGDIVYNTGAILHPIKDRIEMFEQDFDRPEYMEQLQIIEDDKIRQQDHLRSMG